MFSMLFWEAIIILYIEGDILLDVKDGGKPLKNNFELVEEINAIDNIVDIKPEDRHCDQNRE